MATETLNINAIDSAFSDPNGAVTDIDEPISGADGNSYGTTTEDDVATFGLTPTALTDAHTINSVTLTVRAQKGGTAGNERFQVDLLIGGVVQGSQQSTGNLTTSFANYTGINDAGWNSDWTQAELNGMQVRLTAIQAGMGGTQVTDLDCIDVIVDYTAPVTFTPEADAFGIYEDGTESGAAERLGENIFGMLNHTLAADQQFQYRSRVQETAGGAGAATDNWGLEYEKNDSASWVAITASSALLQADTASSLTDGGATTDRLSAGTGSFVAGEQEEINGVIEDLQLTADNYTNLLWGLKPIEGDISSGDYVKLRVTLNGSPISNTITAIIYFNDGPIIRGVTSGRNGSFTTDITPTLPSGAEADWIAVYVGCDEGGTDFDAAPGNWVKLQSATTQAILGGVFGLDSAGASEADPTFSHGALSQDHTWFCFRGDGHDTSDAFDVSNINSGDSNAPLMSALTTTVDNTAILCGVILDGGDNTVGILPPTGTLEYAKMSEDQTGSDSEVGSVSAVSVKGAFGGTGTATWATSTADGWHAMGVAVKPPAVGGNNAPLFMHHFKQMANN